MNDESSKPENTVTIELDTPIERAGGNVAELVLRKPKAGELRGLRAEELFNTSTDAIFTLLPRICTPMITPGEIGQIESDDWLEICGAVKGFFMPAKLREAIEAQFAIAE